MTTTTSLKHLRPETRQFWQAIVDEYELSAHHLRLLLAACESWDRMTEARETVETDGPYYTDKRGIRHPHPALAVEKESRAAFARLLKSLNLDLEIPQEGPGRPPGT
jgi:P27 family predicted phage terminase small subunit